MGGGCTASDTFRVRAVRFRPTLLEYLFVFAAFALFCPLSATSSYKAATANGPPSAADQTTQQALFFPPDHVVRDGKLFLRVQTTRSTSLVITYLGGDRWDVARVKQFRQDHPELETYWPDRTQEDGGVTWLVIDRNH
jgi:hypothetical protein